MDKLVRACIALGGIGAHTVHIPTDVFEKYKGLVEKATNTKKHPNSFTYGDVTFKKIEDFSALNNIGT